MQIYCQISFSDIYSLVFFIPKTNVLTSNTHIFTHLHEWRSSDQVRRSHHHTGVQVVVSASWGKFLKDCFNYYSYLLCSFMFFTDIITDKTLKMMQSITIHDLYNDRVESSRCIYFPFIVPSKRRLPMCRMAASSLEISQFSVSVNMRTFMADRMLE